MARRRICGWPERTVRALRRHVEVLLRQGEAAFQSAQYALKRGQMLYRHQVEFAVGQNRSERRSLFGAELLHCDDIRLQAGYQLGEGVRISATIRCEPTDTGARFVIEVPAKGKGK